MTANSLDSRIRALVVEVAETSPPAPTFDELTPPADTAELRVPANAMYDNVSARTIERARVGHSRRRQQVIAAAVVLGGLLAATAAVLWLTTTARSGHPVVATPPGGRKRSHPVGPTGEPASILVHTITNLRGIDTSDLVELAASDGHIQRHLAQVPSGITMYGITADRTSVYLDGFNATGGVPCPGQNKSRVSVLRESLQGGEPVLAATGARPMVSPDATKLAYIRSDCGTPSQPFVPEHLAVRNLATGTEHIWSLPPPYRDGNTAGFENVGPPEWAADGRHLLLRVVSGGHVGAPATGPTTWWWIDTRAPSGAVHAVRLPMTSGPRAPLDVIPLGRTGRWAALLPGRRPSEALRVVNYRPSDAATGSELTTFQSPSNATVHLIDADASGTHLLLLVTTGGSETQAQTTDLYKWSPGQRQPIAIAHNVVAATW